MLVFLDLRFFLFGSRQVDLEQGVEDVCVALFFLDFGGCWLAEQLREEEVVGH